jgi:23S rRNA pseudouridine1911/1915/1917 synthase
MSLPEAESSELYEHYRFVVDKGQSLIRIDKYLTHKIENIFRNRIQNSADAGNIHVNGTPVKSNYRVKPLDIITILLAYPPQEIEIIPEDIPLDIVYEDECLLMINKAVGMVVHPGHGNFYGTMMNALLHHFIATGIAEKSYPYLVHRIDKDTSGILVVAKDELSQSKLAKQFFHHTVDRKYNALVWGDFKEDTGTIEGHIGRSKKNRLEMDVYPEGDHGKAAITHYRVLERFGYVTLIECVLETGRTHQIRAHMKHIGHPIFNDSTYGGNQVLRGTIYTKYKQFIQNCFDLIPRQALHAKTLEFVHPALGQAMLFDSELPADFQAVLLKWRDYRKAVREME